MAKNEAVKTQIQRELEAAEREKAAETKARAKRRDLVARLRHARAGGYLSASEKKRLSRVSRGLGLSKKPKKKK